MNENAMANFYSSLTLMLQGMGGIFIVMLVIYIAIKILIKFFPEK